MLLKRIGSSSISMYADLTDEVPNTSYLQDLTHLKYK